MNLMKENFILFTPIMLKMLKKKNILSYSNYQDEKYISSVIKDNYLGVQFHPEKSGENGLEFLKKGD